MWCVCPRGMGSARASYSPIETIMRSFRFLATAVLLACGSGASDQDATVSVDSLTQRQRDSMIGASGLPGARGITRAQRITDSLNARSAAPDSIDRDP